MLSGCLGGVIAFYTQTSLEYSASPEWLPRWVALDFIQVVASVGCIRLCLNGCLGGGSCLGGVHSFSTEWLPRWGRGVLFMYSLRQSDTLNSLRQYDTMIKN